MFVLFEGCGNNKIESDILKFITLKIKLASDNMQFNVL